MAKAQMENSCSYRWRTGASMKESVSSTCWFLGFVISICFVVFIMTAQEPKVVDECNLLNSINSTTSTISINSTNSTTCAKTEHCHFGFFLGWSMYIWMKIGIVLFLVAAGLLWPVKATVDTAAAEEGRAASDEDKEHKAAIEDHSQAIKAMEAASKAYKDAEVADAEAVKKALVDFQQSIGAVNLAAKKKEKTKPARGMSRVVRSKLIRLLYCASLISLTAGASCANISFFLSLESEIGCVRKVAYYIPHAAPAILIAINAFRFGVDACFLD